MKKHLHRKPRKLELQTETVKKLVRIDDDQLDRVVGGAAETDSKAGCGGSGLRTCVL